LPYRKGFRREAGSEGEKLQVEWRGPQIPLEIFSTNGYEYSSNEYSLLVIATFLSTAIDATYPPVRVRLEEEFRTGYYPLVGNGTPHHIESTAWNHGKDPRLKGRPL
jgi:hypothetical protein